jgi:hypothetical protein
LLGRNPEIQVQFFSYKMWQWRAKILFLCIEKSTLTLSV